jgi:rifampin ADP-ribosylating transferase
MTKANGSVILDDGPFYHGTKAVLQVGELLTPGFRSNYHADVIMNHVYFTAMVQGAALAAELARGEGQPRVYLVEPMGEFENDPNVTDKKLPGNPTRSFRSKEPLKIVQIVQDWIRLEPSVLKKWQEDIARLKADPNTEIIN